jgi:anaerobic selenocysteine-containing dehydrogenase
VSEAVLSVASDPYLGDHVYHGQRVLPAVMAFEAMAQHAAAVLPGPARVTIENAVFQSPIVVPRTDPSASGSALHGSAIGAASRRFAAK